MKQPEPDILKQTATPETGQSVALGEWSLSTDQQLLGEYAATQSDEAFAEIVGRHAGLVYSAALRQTGNPTAAEEITQAVFVILARKASSLRRETVLEGWLFRAVRYAALDFRKVEARRVRREQEATGMNSTDPCDEAESAWEQMAPLIDEALASLSAKDRNAILLRFFQAKSFRDIGAVLGGNENSARLRVVRALAKLHGFFQRRGVCLSAGSVSSALLIPATQAMPTTMVSSVMGVIASGECPASATIWTQAMLRGIGRWKWTLWSGGLTVALFVALFVTGRLQEDPARIRAEVRTAVLAIDNAISLGDTGAFLAHVHFRNAEEAQLKPVFAAFIRAAVGLRQQVRESFGAQPVRQQIWIWMAGQLMAGQPRSAQDSFLADRVTDDFFQSHLVVLVKVESAWKWDYFRSLSPDVARERMRALQEGTVLCERVTRDIEQGEITSAEQALAQIQGHKR